MTTTSKLGDFLGRALSNDNPGSSAAKDYLGRDVTAGNKDALGRALVDTPNYPPAARAVATAYPVGAVRRVPGIKEVQTLSPTGTPVGTLRLNVTLRGVTKPSGPIALANITQATIQTAINQATNVRPGDVTVGGTGPDRTLTFEDELGDVALVTADNAQVTGGTYAVAETTKGAARGELLKATVAGTSHASNPVTPPAVGATVVDGTVTWRRLK